MKRRSFITLLGSVAATWSIAARGQRRPVVGVLMSGALEAFATRLSALRQGLKESGFVEGQNLTVIYRSPKRQSDRLSELETLASELVRERVDVIVGIGSTDPARAAKAATATVPIVFAVGGDPIGAGLVVSLNRPGDNVTGITWFATELQGKRLELLRDLLPQVRKVGFLLNPNNVSSQSAALDLRRSARLLGQTLIMLNAADVGDIERAFARAAHEQVEAVLVQADSLFSTQRDEIVELAARQKLPAIYPDREFIANGGLMSYEADIADAVREAGHYVGRILKGGTTADLPVMQPTKFELVINRRTAKTLGIIFPPSFELRASEVIE